MNEVENALRLIEKINDRHEAAIEESRKEISELKIQTSTQAQQITTVTTTQDKLEKTQSKLEKVQQELQLFKSKLAGGIAVGVAVFEIVKAKFFG